MKAISFKKFINKKNKDFPVAVYNFKHSRTLLFNNNRQFESYKILLTNSEMENFIVAELGRLFKIDSRSRFEKIKNKIALKLEIWSYKIKEIIRIIKE